MACFLQVEKYQSGEFGHCSRYYCDNQLLLPVGKVTAVIFSVSSYFV